jgi:hypothetical protein
MNCFPVSYISRKLPRKEAMQENSNSECLTPKRNWGATV